MDLLRVIVFSLLFGLKGEKLHLPIPLGSFVPAVSFWVDEILRTSTQLQTISPLIFHNFTMLSLITFLDFLIPFWLDCSSDTETGSPGWQWHWRKAENDCGFRDEPFSFRHGGDTTVTVKGYSAQSWLVSHSGAQLQVGSSHHAGCGETPGGLIVEKFQNLGQTDYFYAK